MMTRLRLLTLCLSALSLLFAVSSPLGADAANRPAEEHVVLAGGCFWGMEAVFERVRGVRNVVSGFAGGSPETAHYEAVSTGMTGHAESVHIIYDPTAISFQRVLDVFFTVAHDPTQLNRQGPDTGTQYRSEIFYTSEDQRRTAEATIKRLTQSHAFSSAIVTKLEPLRGFYPAETYHQHFVDKNPQNPYVVENDLPKLAKLREKFASLLKGSTT